MTWKNIFIAHEGEGRSHLHDPNNSELILYTFPPEDLERVKKEMLDSSPDGMTLSPQDANIYRHLTEDSENQTGHIEIEPWADLGDEGVVGPPQEQIDPSSLPKRPTNLQDNLKDLFKKKEDKGAQPKKPDNPNPGGWGGYL